MPLSLSRPIWAGDADRGGPWMGVNPAAQAAKIWVDFHAVLPWILTEGLGNGTMIGYGWFVVMGHMHADRK